MVQRSCHCRRSDCTGASGGLLIFVAPLLGSLDGCRGRHLFFAIHGNSGTAQKTQKSTYSKGSLGRTGNVDFQKSGSWPFLLRKSYDSSTGGSSKVIRIFGSYQTPEDAHSQGFGTLGLSSSGFCFVVQGCNAAANDGTAASSSRPRDPMSSSQEDAGLSMPSILLVYQGTIPKAHSIFC